MFDRQVMNRFYNQAKTPSDIPWHRDDPYPFLVNALREIKPGRVLDLGCGTGAFSVYLAKQGFEVTGLDFFPRALEMASEKAQKEGVKVDWVSSDLFEWKPSEKFDLILDSGCLHSLVGGSHRRYKAQILSWLTPKGEYILGHWGKKHKFDWFPIGPRRRSRKTLEKLFLPELKLVKFEEDVMTGVPKPFGPTILGLSLWFKRTP